MCLPYTLNTRNLQDYVLFPLKTCSHILPFVLVIIGFEAMLNSPIGVRVKQRGNNIDGPL